MATDNDRFVTFSAHLRRPMAQALQEEADEIGISRMALIQVILHNHLKAAALNSEVFSQAELDGTIMSPDLHRPRGVGFAR